MTEITPEGSAAPVFSVDIPQEAGDSPIKEIPLAELRQEAYRQEADPLYFKWQRGEATEQEWLNAIQSIKDRYPKEELPWT